MYLPAGRLIFLVPAGIYVFKIQIYLLIVIDNPTCFLLNRCLIESDPGVFTELIHKFGVEGVQVEEIYSLDEDQFRDLKPVYGLIFLFKWVHDENPQGSLVKDSRIQEMFFAKQVNCSLP